MDPAERIEVLDAENIDIAILYTTVGLLWEAEVEDPALSQAYTKAYNRWICEFCADEARLVPTAHLSLTDRGVTFATNSRQGLCVSFVELVHAIEPTGVLRHPAATVTVADPEALAAALRR